jgi:hypothetical protein
MPRPWIVDHQTVSLLDYIQLRLTGSASPTQKQLINTIHDLPAPSDEGLSRVMRGSDAKGERPGLIFVQFTVMQLQCC